MNAHRLRRALALLGAGAVVLCASCRRVPPVPEGNATPAPATAFASGRTGIFVSILPEAYFVERVGSSHVDVRVLVGPGQNPHTFEPTPDQMNGLAKARVFFRIGMPFEDALLPKVQALFKQLEVVDLRQGITLRHMEAHEAEEHGDEHGDEGHHHGAGGDDPHTWLSPKLAKIQAQTIADTLVRLDPAHADDYRHNVAALQADLDALDARITAALAPVRGKAIFVFHPAFGYFTDAYGLKQVPVEIEGKEPSARDVAALIQRAKAEGVKVIFVQPQFSARTAEVIAHEIGGAVVPLDDLPRDYITSLDTMAQAVRKALSGSGG